MRELTEGEIETIFEQSGLHDMRQELQDYTNSVSLFAVEEAMEYKLTPHEAKMGLQMALDIWRLTDLRSSQISNFS